MDRYLVRKARETWRPIVHSGPKLKKKQTTITSLSGVVSLDEISALRDDLLGLIGAFAGGTPLNASFNMVSVAEERAALQRAKIAEREEQEMSADDEGCSAGESAGEAGRAGVVPLSLTASEPQSAEACPSSSSSASTLLAHTDALLTRLESVRISLETLEKTMVGRAVKKLTKPARKGSDKVWPESISTRATALVKSWKEVAHEGLQRRKRRKASGIDDPVVPHWKKARLDYHFGRR